jgi:pyrrolidone-carboxylate peptidase
LNILDCPLVLSTSAQCYLCPWIEYSRLPFGSLYQCPMLPMSLDWIFLIALWFSLPVPNVTYVPGLNILDCPLVLSTSAQCYLCPWIEYSWLLFGSLYQCPMLRMSLDWTFLIALWFSLPVPNVTYFPGLNILDCPLVLYTSAQCYLCPWIEHSWLPFGSLYQCPMLPMSLDWTFLIALWFSLPVPNVTYVPVLNILDCPLVISTSAQNYLCPWIEYSWLLFGSLYQCPMLPMSLDWTFMIALWFSLPVPNVTYVPVLNILDCPLVLSTSAQYYLCPWIEYFWLPFGSLYQCPVLPMSLDWIF